MPVDSEDGERSMSGGIEKRVSRPAELLISRVAKCRHHACIGSCTIHR